MNKHVELVKKWLEDKESVSLEDLKANAKVAAAAYDAAFCDYCYDADYAHTNATAHTHAAAMAADSAYDAAFWVKRYEELTK